MAAPPAAGAGALASLLSASPWLQAGSTALDFIGNLIALHHVSPLEREQQRYLEVQKWRENENRVRAINLWNKYKDYNAPQSHYSGMTANQVTAPTIKAPTFNTGSYLSKMQASLAPYLNQIAGSASQRLGLDSGAAQGEIMHGSYAPMMGYAAEAEKTTQGQQYDAATRNAQMMLESLLANQEAQQQTGMFNRQMGLQTFQTNQQNQDAIRRLLAGLT